MILMILHEGDVIRFGKEHALCLRSVVSWQAYKAACGQELERLMTYNEQKISLEDLPDLLATLILIAQPPLRCSD